MNIQKMMKQAQTMQAKLGELQSRLEAEETEGSSGGGTVKIVLTGKGEARRITLDPSVVDAQEKEMLEDLIVAAINDAKGKIDATFSEQMGKLAGGLGLPPGFKLPM